MNKASFFSQTSKFYDSKMVCNLFSFKIISLMLDGTVTAMKARIDYKCCVCSIKHLHKNSLILSHIGVN